MLRNGTHMHTIHCCSMSHLYVCLSVHSHLDLADNQLCDPLFSPPPPGEQEQQSPGPLLELAECLLATNALTALPPFLCHCASLRLLNMNENQLTSLPAEIGLLTRLTHLSLKQNQLRYLLACTSTRPHACDTTPSF
jgi:Leucine-rich repeat (LRR) protein